jgi:hypothetical protein
MREPFLHFDGDLILYPGLRDLNLEKRDLVFEFKNESFSDDHLKSIDYLDKLLFDETSQYGSIPAGLRSSRSNTDKTHHYDFSRDNSNPLKTIAVKPQQQFNHYRPEILIKSSKAKSYLINPNTAPVNSGRLNTSLPLASEFSQAQSSKYELGELNCGVIGGKDYRFLNAFASWSLDLFNKNLGKLDSEFLKYNKNFINSYFEQHLLYRYIINKGKAFSCIYEKDPRQQYQRDFFLPVCHPSRIMIHFILNLKIKYSLEIELTLRLNYPEWYARINDLIERNII